MVEEMWRIYYLIVSSNESSTISFKNLIFLGPRMTIELKLFWSTPLYAGFHFIQKENKLVFGG
jgi:hypothetical protein